MCAGGPLPTNSEEEREVYGQDRISEGKVPVCAAMGSTKALLVGESDVIEKIYNDRVTARGYGEKDLKQTTVWKIAYYAGDRLKLKA